MTISALQPSTATAGLTTASFGAEASLAQELGMSATVAAHLVRLGLAEAAAALKFLEPKLADLTPPADMVDRAAAAERLARAIRARERICVFGDYDCDGITAAAILTETVRTLGGEAIPLLATRFDGGYGVSAAALRRIRETGASLVVTCDCGSSDHERLEALKQAGVDVIVIDHHLVPDEPLPALAFLNPRRPDCGFPYKGLASCGLVLSIGAALRAEMGVALDLRQWLDLVAIGTIADVAPLDGDNRALVRAGLGRIQAAQRPGIRALLELSKLEPAGPMLAQDVAFGIAPHINAPGRMGDPLLALELLTARDADTARGLAAQIEQISLERRAQQKEILAEAEAEIEREGYGDRPALVLGREGWNHGIVGIVAGRLCDRFQRPVIVVGFEGGRGRGSVRGPSGARLYDALDRCRDALVRFGGHQAAAGVEVELARLGELREAFESACVDLGGAAVAQQDPALRFIDGDEPARVLADLARLEPCGASNPLPRLEFSGRCLVAREVRGGHLKLELELSGGRRISGFGIAMGSQATSLSGHVRVTGTLRPDRWRGGDAVEVRVESVQQGAV